MHSYYTPLRYPGGKRKLAPFLKDLFRHNNLCDGTYVEPYAGGAAVALTLLLEGYAWEVVINDIDPHIHAFWWAVLNRTEELVRRIQETPVTIEEWHRQKLVLSKDSQQEPIDVGFATFFLNRTNRSGILHGGVIGGKNQDGPFKIEARFNKTDLINRIELIAKYRGRIKLYNLDALDLIERIGPTLPMKTLLYFDPPYYHKAEQLYRSFYTPKDHERVASVIKSLPFPWVVTYDDVPEVRKLYQGEEIEEFSICYSAHLDRPRKSEVMFYRHLILPSPPMRRKQKKLNGSGVLSAA